MIRALTILGLDPGLRHTGWGLVRQDGNRLSFIAAGRISPDTKLPMAARLCASARAVWWSETRIRCVFASLQLSSSPN